jgi:NAD(P)-dependent dehydrogenase (short-subunit alcohol dehydrogenase family)/acyl carrier protein
MVASHLHEVVDGDRVEPAKATVLGACKVIHQESAHLSCCSIDVVPPPPGSPAEERLADQLLAELAAAGPELEPAVAYRGRQRWVRRFERLRLAEDPMEEGRNTSRLRAGGAYLITDAVHAVGLGAAEYLTGLGARVALVLPPDFPAREKWEGWQGLPEVPPGQDVAAVAIRRLLALEPLPGVAILRADVTDAGQVRAALAAARERFGPLDGILHTSGLFTGGLIQLKTPESLEAALRPVVRGAEALFAVLDDSDEAPGFVALTGSTLTFAGGLGQLDIAAAGAYVDALAQSRAVLEGDRNGGGPEVLAVHWDPYQWGGWLALGTSVLPGVTPEQLSRDLETYGTPPERSGEALRRLLATPLTRAVVSARDLEALIAETDAFTTEVFLAQMEKALAEQQGRERAGRAGIAIPFVEPQTELEQRVADVWEELFGIQPIGRDDHFLELGGHSLLAIQMATHLRNLFSVDLPVTVLFEAPTVRELAAVIAGEQGGGEAAEEDLEGLLALVEGLSPEEALERMQELGVAAE